MLAEGAEITSRKNNMELMNSPHEGGANASTGERGIACEMSVVLDDASVGEVGSGIEPWKDSCFDAVKCDEEVLQTFSRQQNQHNGETHAGPTSWRTQRAGRNSHRTRCSRQIQCQELLAGDGETYDDT